jgi:hypothetical protein
MRFHPLTVTRSSIYGKQSPDAVVNILIWKHNMYPEIYHRVLHILIAGAVAAVAATMSHHSFGSSLTSGFIVSDDELPMTYEDAELLLLTLPHTSSKYGKKKHTHNEVGAIPSSGSSAGSTVLAVRRSSSTGDHAEVLSDMATIEDHPSPEFEEHSSSTAAAQPVSLPHQHHITTATAAQSNMMLWQGAQPSLLAPPAAANSLPQTANRQVQLSRAAGQQLIELHQAENRLLQPLEAQSCAGLIGKLQGLAVMKFGAVLRDAIALSALEVSRHLPGAHGWPSAEGALGCLQLQ